MGAVRPTDSLLWHHPADYFRGEVPVTDPLTDKEIDSAYERNTGEVILRRFQDLDPMAQPGYGGKSWPVVWGKTATEAAFNATIVEYIARLAYRTELINPKSHQVSAALLRKHYERKHGPKHIRPKTRLKKLSVSAELQAN